MKNKDGIGFKAERDSWRVGFKPNGRGELLNLCELVYHICCKMVEYNKHPYNKHASAPKT